MTKEELLQALGEDVKETKKNEYVTTLKDIRSDLKSVKKHIKRLEKVEKELFEAVEAGKEIKGVSHSGGYMSGENFIKEVEYEEQVQED